MYTLHDDLSIYATRGDTVAFAVSAVNDGERYVFSAGDVVRMKIFGKKDCGSVVLQKEFPVETACEQVALLLTGEDTKIGGVISKPVDYWYEIELNPFTDPQTIVGYDENGPKVFRLFPEGADLEAVLPEEEDIPLVDQVLDAGSERPVANQAVTRAYLLLAEELEQVSGTMTDRQTLQKYALFVENGQLYLEEQEENNAVTG